MSAKLQAVVWGRGPVSRWLETIGGKPRPATSDEVQRAEIPEQDHYQWTRTVEMREGDLHRYGERDPGLLGWAELACLEPAGVDDDD